MTYNNFQLPTIQQITSVVATAANDSINKSIQIQSKSAKGGMIIQ